MNRYQFPARSRCSWFLVSFLILFLSATVSAQRVRADVKLMLERLPLEKQEQLKNLAEEFETYITDYDWTGEAADDEIPISVQVFLQDASVSYESRYAGTFLITNNSDIQYFDRYWRFPFEAGKPLMHAELAFEPFTGFIDFYVYLIIGGEFDKYGRFLGTPFFEKAKQLSDQAQFNVQFQVGWKERAELIEDILSEENKVFRTAKDLFFLGLAYVGEEDSTATRYCKESLDVLKDVLRKNRDNERAKQFIEAHHLEYVDLFKEDNDVLNQLIRIDPERADTYRQYLK